MAASAEASEGPAAARKAIAMGRPRKPTAIKDRQGTLQACRTNKSEPNLPPSLPAPPKGLDADVHAAYMAHGRRLLDMRVLTKADAGSLLAMAQAYVDWQSALRELAKFVAETGSAYYESGETIKAHPATVVRNEADKRYRNWAQSFGMTPSDRSKVSAIEDTGQKSAMAELLEMTG